jgi:hypothetical protein
MAALPTPPGAGVDQDDLARLKTRAPHEAEPARLIVDEEARRLVERHLIR